jgi:high-affinity Fe2+/Pb2+ permease
MAEDKHETRNAAIAAAIILLVAGAALYFMPKIVLGIGAYSPVLGFMAGIVIIMFLFVVIWLRSKYKK